MSEKGQGKIGTCVLLALIISLRDENMMITSHRLRLKKFAAPIFARNNVEKYLAEQASARRFTWLDASIGLGMLLNLVLSLFNAITHRGTIGLIEGVLTCYLIGLLLFPPIRPLIGRLLLASFIAGICELFTDASGQYIVHSLIYPSGEPMLWTSPLYMPLSWLVVVTHLGYLAWRLQALLGWRKAALLSGICGAIQIPIYEEMAYYGGWWRYRPTHLMLGHTPLYVLLFEGLIVAALALLYARIERRSWSQVALIGVVLGAWMPLAAFISWVLLGL
jgi:hypothetical protein